MPVAGVRVAVRAVRRADAALPQAHRRQAVQVRGLRAFLRQERPPGAAHEAAPPEDQQMTRETGRRPAARAGLSSGIGAVGEMETGGQYLRSNNMTFIPCHT